MRQYPRYTGLRSLVALGWVLEQVWTSDRRRPVDVLQSIPEGVATAPSSSDEDHNAASFISDAVAFAQSGLLLLTRFCSEASFL